MVSKKGPKRSSNFASCIVGTLFLVFIIIILLILFFSLFKAKDPRISVKAIQVPNFYVSGYPDLDNSMVNFTISLYVSVKNPNRASFNHYESNLQLNYHGNQIGFMFIPAGKIRSQRTEFLSTTLSVQPFPLILDQDFDQIEFNSNASLPIETRLKMAGRVRVLHFFTHHAQASADCKINIALDGGSVLNFHCT
eukprot:Gb_10305 [translate_table: standard]